MDNLTISIFNNKIFFDIVKEIKLFSKYQFKHYENLDLCIKEAENQNQIVIFFTNISKKVKVGNFPMIYVAESKKSLNKFSNSLKEELIIPFKIIDFEKKLVSLIGKNQFRKNSLINLNGYTIDKNERKLKKNNLEIQLSEKEINFLILFSENKEPINRNIVLKNVWKYSEESETHTIETHIHRLRKKIFEKFGEIVLLKIIKKDIIFEKKIT